MNIALSLAQFSNYYKRAKFIQGTSYFIFIKGADSSGTDGQGLTIVEHVEQNIDDMKEKIEQRSFRGNSMDQDGPRQQSQSLMVSPCY